MLKITQGLRQELIVRSVHHGNLSWMHHSSIDDARAGCQCSEESELDVHYSSIDNARDVCWKRSAMESELHSKIDVAVKDGYLGM